MREQLYVWKYEKLAEKISQELKKRGFETWVVKSKEELLKTVDELITPNSTVAVGGSVSLQETGILEFLRSGKYNFLDRYSVKNAEERREIELKSLGADYFLCSANAITEDGKLVFLDGNGNRVAALSFGPRTIIIVASVNKVVPSVQEARERIRYISPMNCKRLNLETPCTKTGWCIDCSSPMRICNYFLVVETSYRQPGRFKIILTTFELGL